MLQSWRWFGHDDPVSLRDARQAGAHGIVTALHHIYDGRVWSPEEIAARAAAVRAEGFVWSVCESIPVHSSIKLRSGPWRRYVDAWKDTLANLGRAGVPVVCYNFMPVVDWTRTDLAYPTGTDGLALRFDMVDFVAYDAFVLKRKGAETDYPQDLLAKAEVRLAALDEARVAALEANIIAGLPGREDSYTREGIRARIGAFDGLTSEEMRQHLFEFLREIVPVAVETGVKLGIHPDDPPFPLFGLPRVVSTADDLRRILGCVDERANGLTFCVGSLTSRADNDVVAMVQEFAPRIHFAHLRNVRRAPDGSFVESDHLDGDTDMVAVVTALLREERRRTAENRSDRVIPMRPDHGHVLVDDVGKRVNPGYSCIGRLKGLAELRGVMAAVDSLLSLGLNPLAPPQPTSS
jgi:mannonate dehydratase